jgi:hypothetical protein
MKLGMWRKGAEVMLTAEDSLCNFTSALCPGDHVWFTGYLMNGGGKESSDHVLDELKPQVGLEGIGCLGFHRSDLQTHKKGSGRLKSGSPALLRAHVHAGVRSALSFTFSLIVICK